MSTSPAPNATGYTYVPRTTLWEDTTRTNGIHTGIRRLCTRLWETKAKRCDFRLVKTYTIADLGSGNMSFQLRKFGDVFVIGQRAYRSRHGANYSEKPLNTFWTPPNSGPFFIVTKDQTFMPAYADKSRANMLRGMGLWNWSVENAPKLVPFSWQLEHGGAFVYKSSWTKPDYYVQGGLIFTDTSVDAYGATLKDPTIQVYDKALYKAGRDALQATCELIDYYSHELGVLEATHIWGNGWSWPEEFVFKVLQVYRTRGLDDLTPHWLIAHLNKAAVAKWSTENPGLAGYSWRVPDFSVPRLSVGQAHRQWRHQALSLGISRFVEEGTPLYNEVSPIEPITIDYDRLILEN